MKHTVPLPATNHCLHAATGGIKEPSHLSQHQHTPPYIPCPPCCRQLHSTHGCLQASSAMRISDCHTHTQLVLWSESHTEQRLTTLTMDTSSSPGYTVHKNSKTPPLTMQLSTITLQVVSHNTASTCTDPIPIPTHLLLCACPPFLTDHDK